MLGAGKTLLISNVIHTLRVKFEAKENVGVAYVYCNFRRKG